MESEFINNRGSYCRTSTTSQLGPDSPDNVVVINNKSTQYNALQASSKHDWPHYSNWLVWSLKTTTEPSSGAVDSELSQSGALNLPQEQQVKQLVWYRFPMAWQAWLAPYTPFPHLTQIPGEDTEEDFLKGSENSGFQSSSMCIFSCFF